MRQEFSNDTKAKSLQLLSLAYIATQKKIEAMEALNPYEEKFIREVHHNLYIQEGKSAFLITG